MTSQRITALGVVLVLLMMATLVSGAPVDRQDGLTGAFQVQTSTPRPPASPTVTPTFEPGGGEIRIGEAGAGYIHSSDQVDSWTFPGNRGDIISITLQSGGMNLLLTLYGPAGNQLVIAGNNVFGREATIYNYILPASGMYGIQVITRDGRGGSYALYLERGVMPSPTFAPPTPGPSPTPFNRPFGLTDTTSAEVLPDSDGDFYVVAVEQPVVVEVLLESADLSSTLNLVLIAPDGSIQTLINFSNQSPSMLLPYVLLYMPGRYVFHVINPRNYPVAYSLSLAVNESVNARGRLIYGQGVSGELMFPGQGDRWVFEGLSGDLVDIIMNGIRPLDSYLTLYDAAGHELTRSDNVSQRSTDARITFRLPADGEYTIGVSSKNAASLGQYRLQLYLVASSQQ